jgi:hypothetical protein
MRGGRLPGPGPLARATGAQTGRPGRARTGRQLDLLRVAIEAGLPVGRALAEVGRLRNGLVLEIHIDDQPVCAGCGWPAALDGHCVCGDFQPEPHLLALVYTDVRATRAANGQA